MRFAPILMTVLFLPAGWLRAETIKEVRKKMGSRFEITLVTAEPDAGRAAMVAAWAEIDRLEAMISSWKPDSETSQINREAGIQPVAVSAELFNLVRRALKVSTLTGGAFDISFGGVGRLWDFRADPPRLPDKDVIRAALHLIDYQKIKLDPERSTIFLQGKGMAIGFGAIGKGYAANRALHVLRELGMRDGLVNAGGDLVATGRQEDGEPWSIGIADPREREHIFAYLALSEQAVVTSGDYERFIIIDGKRYSHIINPKTGYPVENPRSVTIICPDAELADALATAVSVMGPKKGMALVNRLKGVECLMVDTAGNILYSENIQTQLSFTEEQP